jgi:hypothetical protein
MISKDLKPLDKLSNRAAYYTYYGIQLTDFLKRFVVTPGFFRNLLLLTTPYYQRFMLQPFRMIYKIFSNLRHVVSSRHFGNNLFYVFRSSVRVNFLKSMITSQ